MPTENDFAALDAAVARSNNHAMTIMAEKLKAIAAETRNATRRILGNGDPEKSILWILKELTSLATRIEEQQATQEARLVVLEEHTGAGGAQVQTRFELFWRMWNTAGPWLKFATVAVAAYFAFDLYTSFGAFRTESKETVAAIAEDVRDFKRGIEIRIPVHKPKEEE